MSHVAIWIWEIGIFEVLLGFLGWIEFWRFGEMLQVSLVRFFSRFGEFGGILLVLMKFSKIWWDLVNSSKIWWGFLKLCEKVRDWTNFNWIVTKLPNFKACKKKLVTMIFLKIISKSTRHTKKSENTFNPFIRRLDLIAKRSA